MFYYRFKTKSQQDKIDTWHKNWHKWIWNEERRRRKNYLHLSLTNVTFIEKYKKKIRFIDFQKKKKQYITKLIK